LFLYDNLLLGIEFMSMTLQTNAKATSTPAVFSMPVYNVMGFYSVNASTAALSARMMNGRMNWRSG
jgi:hypothetical protein